MTVTTPGTTRAARWARGLAVAVVTAPAVLVAQAVTAGTPPSVRAALVVCAVVALAACVVPTRTARGTAAVAALAQLVGHAVLTVTTPPQQAAAGCLSVVGRGADLGVRYALADGACPPGTVPAGPTLSAVVAAMAAAAAVLLGHALLAAVTGVLVSAAATGLGLVRRLADAVAPVLAALRGVRVVPAGAPAPPLPEPPALTDRWQPARALRRGPPVRLPATA